MVGDDAGRTLRIGAVLRTSQEQTTQAPLGYISSPVALAKVFISDLLISQSS